jgi:hypothetical protein
MSHRFLRKQTVVILSLNLLKFYSQIGVKINYQIADEGIRNNAQINTIFDELECFFIFLYFVI